MIDAHLHVVDPTTTGDDRTGNPRGRWWDMVDAAPATLASRVRDAGVGGGVLVQAVGAHGFDNSLVLEAARTLGAGWRAMIALDPTCTDPLSQLDDAAAAGATGLRLFSIRQPWLRRELAVELVERCATLGLVPSVCCLAGELPDIGGLATAVPDQEIAVDHCGFVEIGGDDTVLAELATRPNVVMKLSTGVFDDALLAPPAAARRLLDLFGADRIAWGSDHPQVHDRTYFELVALARQAVDALPDTTRTAILERTTARLWF